MGHPPPPEENLLSDKHLAMRHEVGTLARMKGASLNLLLPVLAALVASAAFPATAGTLYKCTGGDGVPAYVSKRIGGASCEVISRYTPDRSRPAAARVSSRGCSPPGWTTRALRYRIGLQIRIT